MVSQYVCLCVSSLGHACWPSRIDQVCCCVALHRLISRTDHTYVLNVHVLKMD